MSADEADDDDFGDFEEAQQFEGTDLNVSPEQTSGFKQPDPIEELFNDHLWDLEEILRSKLLESDGVVSPLFSSATIDSDISAELWAKLKIVEEAYALKFRWTLSDSYAYFVKSLHLTKRVQLTEKAEPDVLTTTGKPTNSSPEAETAPQMINSLSVPPVEFDWDSSGLFNLLNSPTAQNGEGSGHSVTDNSSDILNRDLQMLGLDSKSPSTNHSANGCVRSLVGEVKFLSVSDLNEQAQNFYNRLPDLSFMLSDRVAKRFHE